MFITLKLKYMNRILFDSFHQWKVCFISGCKSFSWGLARIISCLILGLFSIVRACWRNLIIFVSNNPKVTIISALVIVFIVWISTFTSMRAMAVGAECQRDSVSYELYMFKKNNGYE